MIETRVYSVYMPRTSGAFVLPFFKARQKSAKTQYTSQETDLHKFLEVFIVKSTSKVRKLAATGMLSALATVLMFFSFNVPLMPSFIKMDFSELPALIASFAYGPTYGVVVCLVKNLINLMFSSTGGVGELSNFLLGTLFVFPRGFIYKRMKTRKGAFLGALAGAVTMAVVGVFTNYFLVYPAYTVFMPMEAIMNMYQLILPSVKTLWQALLIFNMPFTFLKGMVSLGICMLIYKPLSPILKGKNIS